MTPVEMYISSGDKKHELKYKPEDDRSGERSALIHAGCVAVSNSTFLMPLFLICQMGQVIVSTFLSYCENLAMLNARHFAQSEVHSRFHFIPFCFCFCLEVDDTLRSWRGEAEKSYSIC